MIKFKTFVASAALAVCTLSPVFAQDPIVDEVKAPTVAAVQPVPYDMYKRDEGVLGWMQEKLSHILPVIGQGVEKIAPEAKKKYFAAAEKADAKVQEAMTNSPDANLYVELAANGFEPAKVVVTEFAVPAYQKGIELLKDGFVAAAKGIFSLFSGK